ncbi:hypothetical protein L210DRAFT_986015 [Boletus edulis BED1]|uniref:Uncharacterized protein n=1 Tax=Boletus edulis BED1 TaxID=1328754 RepID=A0AAD4BVQ5_BOLED|nr:hypothetical protein L210DRAFT_986015 [Boletus edulis BED1]
MTSEQCAQNSDGSLKDPKDIQWFNDLDDAQPLLNPTGTTPAQPPSLGQELDVFTTIQPCKPKRATQALNSGISSSAGAHPLPLTSSNPFNVLPVEVSSDADEDVGSFKSDCGSESGDNSSDDSTPELA